MSSSSQLTRYPASARTIRTSRAHFPWRTRTRIKTSHKLTDGERKIASDARKSRKETNNIKVDAALSAVMKIAEGLHHDIGTHSAQYWYEFLLQRAGKKKSTRPTNHWNAFVLMKVRAHNESKCFANNSQSFTYTFLCQASPQTHHESRPLRS